MRSLVLLGIVATFPALAGPLAVRTAPASAADSSVPHDAMSGRATTLKAVSSAAGSGIQATWDFGDGSAPAVSPVASGADVSAVHTYTGPAGSAYTAKLTILDTRSGQTAETLYRVVIREKTLRGETNIAIDEGLWYLYKTMRSQKPGDSADDAVNTQALLRGGFGGSGSDLYAEVIASRGSSAPADPPDSAADALIPPSVARTLVDQQSGDGSWFSGTAQAILTLIAVRDRIESVPITDVTSQVRVTTTGFLYSRATRAYTATMTIQNINGVAIPGPLAVAFTGLTPGVTMNGGGTFSGGPYLPVPILGLDPNETAQLALSFSGPAGSAITFVPVVYSGSFPPAPLTLGCPASTAETGAAYASSLVGAGGIPPHLYGLITGALPFGLTLNPATGEISGTPTTSGPYIFTARLTGGANGSVSALCEIAVKVPVPPLTLSCPAATGQVGVAYSSALAASGGIPGYSYSIQNGALPASLTLNPVTGAISGTPSVAGPNTFTAHVSDSTSGTPRTATALCGVTVAEAAPVQITVQALPAGRAYTVDGNPQSTPQIYNWVPGSTHTIATTSPQTGTAARYTFTGWSDGLAMSHSIVTPSVATVYTATFSSEFELTLGAVPAAGGTFTPATNQYFPGGSTQAVQAVANAGYAFNGWVGAVADTTAASTTVTMTQPRTITARFATAVTLACPSTATTTLGASYSSAAAAAGGTSPYAYSVTTGALPGGLTLNPATGLISGTTNASGTFPFTLRVQDQTSPLAQSVTASCSIAVTNRAPVANGQSVTVLEDTPTLITLSGSDPDGQPVTFQVAQAPAHGTVQLQGSPACGGTPLTCTQQIRYTPAANYNGTDSLTFRTSDGAASSPAATISITIPKANDGPVALPKVYSVQTNMGIRVPAVSGLLVGASDGDSGDAGFTLVLTAEGISGTTSAGGVVSVNATTGAFNFEPPAGFTGVATFTYSVCDNGNPLPRICTPATLVTLNVSGPVIWFVDTNSGVSGSGTLTNPFNTLAAANAVLAPNHRIFVSGTTASGTNVTLGASNWLIGRSFSAGNQFDDVMDIAPPAGTPTRPSLNSTPPTVIRGTVTATGHDALIRGLSIQPPSGSRGLVADFPASQGYRLTVDNIPSITTVGATAVRISQADGNFDITSVNASGANIGVFLTTVNNVGTGFFRIGANLPSCRDQPDNCAGGTISNSIGQGVDISGGNVTLNAMRVTNSGVHGLNASSARNLTVTGSVFDGSTSGDVILANNLRGLCVIRQTLVRGGYDNNIKIVNNGSTVDLTIADSIIRDNSSSGNHGVRFAHSLLPGSGTNVSMTLRVQNSQFYDHRANHIDVASQGEGTMSVILTNNTFSSPLGTTLAGAVNITQDRGSHLTFDVNGNTLSGAKVAAFNIYQSSLATATGNVNGTFRNNTVGVEPSLGLPNLFDGVTFSNSGLGSMTVSVTGNNIRRWGQFGIQFQSGDGSPRLNATVTGNTIGSAYSNPPTSLPLQGIKLTSGLTSADVPNVCMAIGGATPNQVAGAGSAGGVSDIRLVQSFGPAVRLPGLTGAPVAFVSGNNLGASVTTTGTFTGGAACTLP